MSVNGAGPAGWISLRPVPGASGVLGRTLGLLALAVLLAVGPVAAQPAGGEVVELVSCYDGDTCTFRGLDRRVRLAGIDTPEMNGDCRPAARRARHVLLSQLRHAREIRVTVKEIGRYGRYIARVEADGVDMSDWLLERGLAVRYPGDTCPMGGDGSTSRRGTGGPPGSDRDCGDFTTRAAAQRFYEAAGGPARDPHRLDGDGDGEACESMPGG